MQRRKSKPKEGILRKCFFDCIKERWIESGPKDEEVVDENDVPF
jgi:hypothetical protein